MSEDVAEGGSVSELVSVCVCAHTCVCAHEKSLGLGIPYSGWCGTFQRLPNLLAGPVSLTWVTWEKLSSWMEETPTLQKASPVLEVANPAMASCEATWHEVPASHQSNDVR